MFKYTIKRLLTMIPVVLVISILIFGVVKAMPGDEVTTYLGPGSRASEQTRMEVRENSDWIRVCQNNTFAG